MSEADMGGAHNNNNNNKDNSAIDTATVSTLDGGSVSGTDNNTVEGGRDAGGVLVKRGGTATGDKPFLSTHPINPPYQHTLSTHLVNTDYQHTLPILTTDTKHTRHDTHTPS